MSTETSTSAGAVADLDDRLGVYRMMLEARIFEQYAYQLFLEGLVKSTSHLATGQEEVSATGRIYTVEENPRLCGWGAEVVSIIAEEAFYDLDQPIVRITTDHVPLPSADNHGGCRHPLGGPHRRDRGTDLGVRQGADATRMARVTAGPAAAR